MEDPKKSTSQEGADYEKKYKDAFARAKKYHSKLGEDGRTLIGSIFPELAESEDERIRKEIFHFVLENTLSTDMRQHRWIAWLEKQGENSPVLSNSLNIGKKSWTEEDEIGSDATIEILEYFINYAPEFRRPTIRRSIDWLKSLKQRMEE